MEIIAFVRSARRSLFCVVRFIVIVCDFFFSVCVPIVAKTVNRLYRGIEHGGKSWQIDVLAGSSSS
jgi:hypothetical protein